MANQGSSKFSVCRHLEPNPVSEPKFKEGDFARVKATAPAICCPGERVRVICIGVATTHDKMHTIHKVRVGRMYFCDWWVEGDPSPWTCSVGENDLELDSYVRRRIGSV
jgi:hypothetical protein